MALEYSLALDGAFLQDDLVAALDACGFAASADPRTWTGDGVTASVGATDDRFGLYAKAVGFSPASSVLFAVARGDGYEAGMRGMLAAVTAILAALPGEDAVLLANHDAVLLLRRDGETTLTDRDGWWTTGLQPPLIDDLPPPHRFATLPIL